MHTFKGPSGTTFNYHSDMSGDVYVDTAEGHLKVPGRDLLALVAEYVRLERITVIESMEADELLGVKEGKP